MARRGISLQWLPAWELPGAGLPGEAVSIVEAGGWSGEAPKGTPFEAATLVWRVPGGILARDRAGAERFLPSARVLLRRFPPAALQDDGEDTGD